MAKRSARLPFAVECGLHVRIGVKQNEADNQGVNCQGFNKGECQDHGSCDFAADFGIACHTFAGALKTNTHADAATECCNANAEGGCQAGKAKGIGIKGLGGKGHAGCAKHDGHVESYHEKFTHRILLLYCWAARGHSPRSRNPESGLRAACSGVIRAKIIFFALRSSFFYYSKNLICH